MFLHQLKEFIDESGTVFEPSQINISHSTNKFWLPQQNRKKPGFKHFEYHGKFFIIHLNAQVATNKMDDFNLLREKPRCLIVSEHHFSSENINCFQIAYYKLANAFIRESHKWGVADFVKKLLGFDPVKVENSEFIFEAGLELQQIRLEISQ